MRLLKKGFSFLIGLSIIYILISVSINFIFQTHLIGLLEKRLSASFDAEINLKNFKTNLLTQVNLNQIQIKRNIEPAFLLDIPLFKFRYLPLSLFKSRFKGKIEVKDLSLIIKDLKIQENILIDFSLKPRFFNKILDIEEFTLYLGDKPTFIAKGSICPIFKPERLVLTAQIPLLSYPDFNLKDLSLKFELSKDRSFGDFLIRALNYNKLTLNMINSKILFSDNKFYFKDLEADTFKGKLGGEMTLSFSPKIDYELYLKLTGLNLKEITKTFAPSDWQATGIIDGDLNVRVEEKELKDLQGKLYSRGTGTVDINTIRELLSHARVIIDKKVKELEVIFYESLIGDISLHKNEIIVELRLAAKEIDLIFEIKIEPEVLGSFLTERR